MMKDDLLDNLMDTSLIKNLGIKRSVLVSILDTYDAFILDKLLSDGIVTLSNGMTIEVSSLLERVHVLRGIPYRSTRKYKLKLSMDEHLYKTIEDYYEKLKGDIE